MASDVGAVEVGAGALCVEREATVSHVISLLSEGCPASEADEAGGDVEDEAEGLGAGGAGAGGAGMDGAGDFVACVGARMRALVRRSVRSFVMEG